MSQHLILRGDGAGKFLPFARHHLRSLRKRMDINAYQNTVRTRDATVRVQWAGKQEHISIVAAGDEFFAVSHEKIRATRHIIAGAFKGITFGPPEAPQLVLGPKSVGGGFCVYVARSSDGLVGYIYLSPGGIALKKIAEGGAGLFANTTYTGMLRDDGVVVGKQLQSVTYQLDGFGGILQGFCSITQTQGGFASVSMGMAAVFGSPFSVEQTIGPLFCGERTSLVTVTQAFTSRRVVFRSDDGGFNWDVAFDSDDLPANVTLVRPPFLMDADGIIGLWILDQTAPSPDQVHLWRSTDRGASFAFWETPPVEMQALLLGRFFTTLTLGPGQFLLITSIVGPGGFPVWSQIARTLDYGATWGIFPEEFDGSSNASYATSMRLYKTVKDPDTGEPDSELARIVVPVLVAGEGYFCYLSDDGGETWRLGPLLDSTLTGPASPAEPPFLVEPLGSLRRPLAADVAFPHLHDNPV